MLTLEQLRRYQAAAREQATPGELAAARARLAADEPACGICGGGRFVLERVPGSVVHREAPCECMSLGERAAWAGVPERYLDASLESFLPLDGKTRALEWCRQWNGSDSVVFVGASWGTGKTHLGVALVREALRRGRRARFVYVPDFLEDIKARFDAGAGEEQASQFFTRIASEPVLMLDDLGQERATAWTSVELRRLFERRWQRRLTTIVTTNAASAGDIAEYVGGAVASRLREATWITVGGRDMRGAA